MAAQARLVGARYVAWGVLGDDARIAPFLVVGMSPAHAEAVGPCPTGHGIPGELVRYPVPYEGSRLCEQSGAPLDEP